MFANTKAKFPTAICTGRFMIITSVAFENGEVKMTQEEFDLLITELIVPEEKLKSTGNSHKRKQWEKQKYWHLCTIGKSCKLGSLKDYEEIYKFYDSFNHWIRRFQWLSRYGRMAGWHYDIASHCFKRWSCNRKWLRDYAGRKVRQYSGEIVDGGMYRKIYDYVWECD